MEINKPVATIILLMINLILIFLFVIPKYQESYAFQLNLAKKQMEYDSQSDYYIKLMGILKDIDDRKDVLEKIDSALPSNFSFAPVLNFFQKESIQSQLIIKSITFSDVLPETSGIKTEGPIVKSISFTINLSGSYQGLKNLLSFLDRSDRLFQVKSISFASPEFFIDPALPYLSGQLEPYHFKLEVKTYSY